MVSLYRWLNHVKSPVLDGELQLNPGPAARKAHLQGRKIRRPHPWPRGPGMSQSSGIKSLPSGYVKIAIEDGYL